MNHELRIRFANPSTLKIPIFERVFIRRSLHAIVNNANDFLTKTNTRLLSYAQNTIIGEKHVADAIDSDGIFQIAIISKTNHGPLQIMEFKETLSENIGESLINCLPVDIIVDNDSSLTADVVSELKLYEGAINPHPKMENKNQHQDALWSELKKFVSIEDAPLLTKHIELAQKEFGRNLRYAAIDKIQDIINRHSNIKDISPNAEAMVDEIVGALMNLKS